MKVSFLSLRGRPQVDPGGQAACHVQGCQMANFAALCSGAIVLQAQRACYNHLATMHLSSFTCGPRRLPGRLDLPAACLAGKEKKLSLSLSPAPLLAVLTRADNQRAHPERFYGRLRHLSDFLHHFAISLLFRIYVFSFGWVMFMFMSRLLRLLSLGRQWDARVGGRGG